MIGEISALRTRVKELEEHKQNLHKALLAKDRIQAELEAENERLALALDRQGKLTDDALKAGIKSEQKLADAEAEIKQRTLEHDNCLTNLIRNKDMHEAEIKEYRAVLGEVAENGACFCGDWMNVAEGEKCYYCKIKALLEKQ